MRYEHGVRDDTAANGLLATFTRTDGRHSTNGQFHGKWGSWKPKVDTTNAGERICGMQVRFQDPISSGDDTALNGLRALYCAPIVEYNCDWKTIYEGTKGSWKSPVTWDYQDTVKDINIRFEEPCGRCDDTAMNGIKVTLKNRENGATRDVTVWNGNWGSWDNHLSNPNPDNLDLSGLQMRYEHGVRDDTAANGLKARYSPVSSWVGKQVTFNGRWGDWKSEVIGAFHGERICGMQVRFQDSLGGGDDTALSGLKAYFCEPVLKPTCHWKDIYEGGEGEWKSPVTWGYNWYVKDIDIRFEEPCGRCDDTAMNGIRVTLSHRFKRIDKTLTIWNGNWGSWGNHLTGNKDALIGLQMRFEHGVRDDTAANGLKATFADLDGTGGQSTQTFHGRWGVWKSNVVTNTPGEHICGLQVRFQDSLGSGDDTALNGLRAYFCKLE